MKIKLIIFLIFSISAIFAQENEDINNVETFSLKRAVDFAAEKSPELNKIREQLSIKEGEWWGSFGLASPTLSYMKEGINSKINDLFAEQRWSVQQSVDFPLKSYFRLSKITSEVSAYKEKLSYSSLELTANVKSKFVDVLYYKRLLNLRTKQIDLANELKRVATSKLEAGDIAELELMKSDIQLAEAQNYYEDAKQMFHKARYTLFQTIGLDPAEQNYMIQFVDSIYINDIELEQSILLENLNKQPKVKSVQNLLESTEYQVKEAWSSFLPDINFSYYSQDYGSGYDYNGFEVGISVPVWFLFNQNSSIQVAKARNREAEWSLKEEKLSIKTDIENAWHGYEASREKIDRYENIIRELADEFQSLTLTGYQLGELNLLQLLDAQQTYLTSEVNYYNALKDYYLQLIQLEKYLGKELIY